MRFNLFSCIIPAPKGIFFFGANRIIPGHEQPSVFHWKYAQMLMDFNFERIMPDSGAELRKGCDAISPPEPREMVLQNKRV
jgi:hypothetical protein